MERQVEVRQAARDDLVDHYDWLTLEAGEDMAAAMLDAANVEFGKLATTAGLGSPVSTQRRELKGLRKWRVSRFARLLIFYLATDEYLFVLRVLHSSQDWLNELERR